VSRLLQNDRLARFLESARESFDLVLVDSPPVLPVADALTIGRCVDAAILTVRHKVSRLPQVERASRQLSSVGITILGAVVNGVKDGLAPYYGPKPAGDPSRDASVSTAG
jgi:polysaccharide biosynthesis transport protein